MSATWTTVLDDGRSISSRYVILAIGFAAQPYVPELPGLADFNGECHHTARWPQRGLDSSGRRVGVFGTGATGVQVVQEVAKVAADLTVFQRTPAMALPMGQRRLTRAEQDRAKKEFPEFFARRRVGRAGSATWRPATSARFEVDDDQRRPSTKWLPVACTSGQERSPTSSSTKTPTGPRTTTGGRRPFRASPTREWPNCSLRSNRRILRNQATATRTGVLRSVQPAERAPRRSPCHAHRADPPDRGSHSSRRSRRRRAGPGDRLRRQHRWGAPSGTARHGRTVGTRAMGQGRRHPSRHRHPPRPNLLMLYGPQSPTAFWNGPTCAEVQGDWVTDLLVHLRERGDATIEATEDAAREWTTELDLFGEATLLGRADSWYMAANIPGKRRQPQPSQLRPLPPAIERLRRRRLLRICHRASPRVRSGGRSRPSRECEPVGDR